MSAQSRPDAAMSREEADRAFEQLQGIQSRIAEWLYSGVEGHRGLLYLKAHPPAGHTLQVWHDLEPRIKLFGAQYKVLNDRMEEVARARERRGHGRLPELTRLLRDPLVPLGPDGMPAEPGAGAPAQTVTLAELCDRLGVLFGEIHPILTGIEEAGDTVAKRLSDLASALGQIRSRSATLGVRPGPDIELDIARYTELNALAQKDPLAASGDTTAASAGSVSDRLRRLEQDVAAAERGLAALLRLKQSYPERMVAVRSAVDLVAAAEEAVAAARATVTAKIAKVDLPPYAPKTAELLAALETIERSARAPRWAEVAERLPALEQAARAALEDARIHVADASAGLAERDELRGRLDGYRVKADRLGVGEHPVLSDVYGKARDVLWTAPCDLTVAAELIWQYQELVANPPAGEETRRHDPS